MNQKRNDKCGFDGNPDLYGLGIRMGVYFQWVSALIIYWWYPEGRKELAGAYLVFLFALLVAMMVITAQVESTHAVEILLLTYIIFGGVFTIISIGFRKSHIEKVKKLKGSFVHAIMLVMILAVASVYCSWFWLIGIHRDFQETPCGTFGFLFAKVSLDNTHVTKFFAALSLYLAIVYCTCCLFGLVVSVLFLFKVPWAFRFFKNPTTPKTSKKFEPIRRPPPLLDSKRRLGFYEMIWPWFNLGSLIYSVIGIELTLQWNSITGVYTINSVGQLIPFVIGLSGFINVVYEPLKEKWNEAKKRGVQLGNGGAIDSGDIEHEAASANLRLGYLDLVKPVESVTVREWRDDGFKRTAP